MRKGKLLLLISLILGAAYLAYSFKYWGSANTGAVDQAEQVGAGLATAIVLPSIVMEGLAVIFNALAFFMYNRPFALVAAILYTVSLVLFPVYFIFVIVEMIFCYIAFARMEK